MFKSNSIFNNRVFSHFRFPVFFIGIFTGLYLVSLYVNHAVNVLGSFDDRMLGIMTLENLNASFRITLFYRSIFILTATFLLINSLLNYLIEKKKTLEYFLIPAGYTSLLGIFSLLLTITTIGGLPIAQLSAFVLLSLFALCIFFWASGKTLPTLPSQKLFIGAGFLSLMIFVVANYFVSRLSPEASLLMPLTFSGIFLIISLLLLFNIKDEKTFEKWVYILSPSAYLPLIICISAELAMILNQREMPFAGSLIFFTFFIILLLGWMGYRFWQLKKKQTESLVKNIYRFIPVFLIGIIAYVMWEPYRNQSQEMFEMANPSNAMMRIFSFKELPLFGFLNSHLLSEIITGFLYFVLNGYDGSLAYLNYNFLQYLFVGLIVYHFIRHMSGSYLIAIVFSLFIPFTEQLGGESFAYSLLMVFCFMKLIQGQNFRTWLLFWIVFAILGIFRPDMALATIIATAGVALSLPGFIKQVQWKKALVSLATVAVPILLLTFSIVQIQDIPLGRNLHQALLYFTANQAHGSINVITEMNRISVSQYMIIPVLLLVLLAYIIHRRKTIISENPWLYTGMIFMLFFYFINFQRGLLRHGFNEGHDSFLSSFSFLILALSPYVLWKTEKQKSGLLFLLFSFLFVWIIGYPEPKESKSIFDVFTTTPIEKFHVSAGLPRIERVKTDSSGFFNDIITFKSFAKNHLTKEQTFFDLSNSPMLYYYTQKNIPSYFNQGIQNVVTDRLQQYLLEDLANYDIPFCIASNVPKNWFDATDDVPNTLRYFRIAEYFFQRYHPWAIVGGHAVWLRNDVDFPLDQFAQDTISTQTQIYKIRYLPYVWAKFEKDSPVTILRTFNEKEMNIHQSNYSVFFDSTVISPNGNYIDFTINGNGNGEQNYILDFGKDWEIYGQFEFVVKNNPELENYRVRISTMYRWFDKKVNFARIRPQNQSPTGLEVKSISILKAN